MEDVRTNERLTRNLRDMFRCMGSRLPSEKAIELLDYRGEKELAGTLKRCWLELDVHDGGSFVNDFVATVQVHALLQEYEFLRNLPLMNERRS